MDFIFALVVGIIIGIVIGRVVSQQEPIGSIRIDRSDPDGPFLFLELEQDLSCLYDKKTVVVKVNMESYLPRK